MKALQNCQCSICIIGRGSVGQAGNSGSARFKPLGRPPREPKPNKPKSLCGICLSTLGPGLPHWCSLTTRRQNMQRLSEEDPRGAEMQAAQKIRDLAVEDPSSSTVGLRTGGGKTMTVPKPGTKVKEGPVVSAEDFTKIASAHNMSLNEAESLARDLRSAAKDRKLFESDLMRKVREKYHSLNDFYTCSDVEVVTSRKDKIQAIGRNGKVTRPAFHIKKEYLAVLISLIFEARNYHHNTEVMIKIGIDGGGSFEKMCMNVIKVVDDLSSPAKKGARTRYKDGFLTKKFKDSGVKRLFPLVFVQDAKETQDLMAIMVELIDLNSISYVPVFDIKAGLLFLGMCTATASCPCMFCELLRTHFTEFFGKRHGKLRTLRGIAEYAKEYQEAAQAHHGATNLSSKTFYNCENPPLIELEGHDQDDLVVHVVPPCELHILLGLGNDLFKALDEKLKAMNFGHVIVIWLQGLGLKKSEYHGGHFNGSNIVKVLESMGKLKAIMQNTKALSKVLDIIYAMEALNAVRIACFGQELDSDYKRDIAQFVHYWAKCGMSVTVKAHTLADHVIDFLEHKNKGKVVKKGLGFWSEQASEQVHSDFEQKFWIPRGFKRELDHPEYREKTTAAIAQYAASHFG